jgi:hypothetical protein
VNAKSSYCRVAFIMLLGMSMIGTASLFWSQSVLAQVQRCKPISGYVCTEQLCPAGIVLINGSDQCQPKKTLFGTPYCVNSCAWCTGGGSQNYSFCVLTPGTTKECIQINNSKTECGKSFTFACVWAPATKTCCPAAAPAPGAVPAGECSSSKCDGT